VWLISCDGVPHWILVDDLKSIRQLYLSDFFIWDVLGSVPYQYIECLTDQAGAAKNLRLLRLLKLLRLNRVRRLLMMLRQRFPEFEFAITCTELLLSLMLVSHWAAGVFFYIAYGLGDPAGDDYQVFLFTQGWVFSDGVLDDAGELNEHVSGPWLSAMYWSVTTLTTLGYGDIAPGTAEERIVGMIVMCIGCIFFAWSACASTVSPVASCIFVTSLRLLFGNTVASFSCRLSPLALRSFSTAILCAHYSSHNTLPPSLPRSLRAQDYGALHVALDPPAVDRGAV
jgi:hypothetical protein